MADLGAGKYKLIVTPERAARRLNDVVADWLSEELSRPVSKAKARKLIVAGAVYLNGRRVTIPSQVLSSGIAIEAKVDRAKLFGDSTSRDRAFELTPSRILFEDEDLLFVDKPPGLPSQPTLDKTRDNLFAAVERFLAKRDGNVKPYVGVHHRLDRDSSGVVLFTKSRRVNAAVGKAFSEHRVRKTYQAITVARRNLKREWTIKNYLGKISSSSKGSKYGAVRSDGELAETFFRIIEQHPLGLWVEAIPRTGQTHQIRVHLSEYGLPILGDDLYGGDDGSAPRLMLHAAEVVMPHPLARREISVESPLPEDFKQCLQRIQKSSGRSGSSS